MRWLTGLRTAQVLAVALLVTAGPASVSNLAAAGASGPGGGHGAVAPLQGGVPVRTIAPVYGGPVHTGAAVHGVPPIRSTARLGVFPPFPVPKTAPLSWTLQEIRPSIRNGHRSVVVVPAALGWYGGFYPYATGSIVYPPSAAPSPSVGVYPPVPATDLSAQYPSPSVSSGWLELRLAPPEAQVYIDGYYAGIVSDFARSGGAPTEAGLHRVEIRASGYQTAAFDVRLTPDRAVTYREDLRPLIDVAPLRDTPTAPAPPVSVTFYVIGDCYAGNVPPSEAMLRPGCDPADVKTVVVRH